MSIPGGRFYPTTAGFDMSLKHYQCHKKVHAEPMTHGEFYKDYVRSAGVQTVDSETSGYRVIYSKGLSNEYISWSPKAEFDDGYTELPPAGPSINLTA